MLRQRNNDGLLFRVINRLNGDETGVTLIEALVALAILGLIAVAFLGGLTTAAQATFIADERATAESLARSQLEYVKNQDYIDYEEPEHEGYDILATIPANYRVEIDPVPIDPDTGLPSDDDAGMQKITVTVSHNGEPVLTVDGYKVDRYEAE